MLRDAVTSSPASRARAFRRGALAAVTLAWICLASGPAASQVLINPVVVEFNTNQRIASVTVSLSDKAAAPMRLQAQVLRWEQDPHGADVSQPSNDLLVTPPIADVRPGEKQLFRIALRGARQGPAELAYRLILEDVASAAPGNSGANSMSIQFRMRYDLPVLIAPSSPVVNALQWQLCQPAALPGESIAPGACVRILNAGNRRVKVKTLTLVGDGWQQAWADKDGINILAGAQREWHVPLEAGKSGPPRGVQIFTARGETLQAEGAAF